MTKHIVVKEDADWIYGETHDTDGIKLTDWIKPKSNFWFHSDWKTIIRDKLNLPLNDEMIKQTIPFEGDCDFLDHLYLMCNPDWIELTDKQVNFMARFLIAHYDLVQDNPAVVVALKQFAISGLKAGVSTKEIESTIKQIRAKHI